MMCVCTRTFTITWNRGNIRREKYQTNCVIVSLGKIEVREEGEEMLWKMNVIQVCVSLSLSSFHSKGRKESEPFNESLTLCSNLNMIITSPSLFHLYIHSLNHLPTICFFITHTSSFCGIEGMGNVKLCVCLRNNSSKFQYSMKDGEGDVSSHINLIIRNRDADQLSTSLLTSESLNQQRKFWGERIFSTVQVESKR